MTLSGILADCYRRLRYNASPAAPIKARLTAYVNETHRDVMTAPAMGKLREDVLPVTISANQARQGLPPVVGRILKITDRTNVHVLEEAPLSELRNDDPSQAFTGGYALRYAIVGERQVAIQPTTTGSGLWAASASASDTTVTVTVHGVRLGGFPFYESTATTLTGTTRVAIGTTTDYVEVDKFFLSTPAIGQVSLYDASSSGNELARIPAGRSFSRYLTVEFWPIATTSVTLYVDYARVINDLVNDQDEPLLPEDFHDLLSLGARMKEYEFLDDTRLLTARQDYTKRLNELRSWVFNSGDTLASLRKTPTRWSQLGPSYPAGS